MQQQQQQQKEERGKGVVVLLYPDCLSLLSTHLEGRREEEGGGVVQHATPHGSLMQLQPAFARAVLTNKQIRLNASITSCNGVGFICALWGCDMG